VAGFEQNPIVLDVPPPVLDNGTKPSSSTIRSSKERAISISTYINRF